MLIYASPKSVNMSSIFRKNLHLCFSKIRCLPTSQCPPLTLDDDDQEYEFEFQNQKLHPKYNTINSIYNEPSLSSSSSATVVDELFTSTSSSSDAESLDLSAIFASQRLFVSSPGHSNSILESLPSSGNQVVGGGVPVNMYSPNPYADFLTSMQEMVDARQRNKEWKKSSKHDDDDDDDGLLEYLQELLLCYLNLNPKHTHKFIIEAFADILVSLMST